MDSEDFGNRISISKLEEKILKIKEMYHPNLIKNLSKEAYDLYLIRKSVCNELLKVTSEKDIKYSKIVDYIKNEIEKNKERLKNASDPIELTLIQLTIEEWEGFL